MWLLEELGLDQEVEELEFVRLLFVDGLLVGVLCVAGVLDELLAGRLYVSDGLVLGVFVLLLFTLVLLALVLVEEGVFGVTVELVRLPLKSVLFVLGSALLMLGLLVEGVGAGCEAGRL